MRQISFECTGQFDGIERKDQELKVVDDTIEAFSKLGKTILVDGGQHSSEIDFLDAKDIKNRFQIIGPGKDGVIIEDITDEDIILIVPLADCGGIGFKHNFGTSLGLIHAGYKGVYSDIIGNFIKRIKEIDLLENFSFYMAPMVGKDYEFSKAHYKKSFRDILKNYNLESENYFQEINETHGYLYLKKLIVDILKKNGVKQNQIEVSVPETNNPKSKYASHRLFNASLDIEAKMWNNYGKNINITQELLEKGLSSGVKFNRLETKLVESGEYSKYRFPSRNLFIVKTGEPVIPKNKM